jgi:preprotein translocase subunit SecB
LKITKKRMMNYKILAKYIKEIDFNIPNPKIFFYLSKNISNYKINIDITSNQFKEKIIEVETKLSLNSTINKDEQIKTKIVYSTIIELGDGVKDKNDLEEIILIKVPTEIYSEIRKSFVFLFETSGFKDIKIDKVVDFKKLYLSKKV